MLDLIREDKLDGIVADEVMAVGRTFGEILELPVVTLSNALPLKMSSEIPPPLCLGAIEQEFGDTFVTGLPTGPDLFTLCTPTSGGFKVFTDNRAEVAEQLALLAHVSDSTGVRFSSAR